MSVLDKLAKRRFYPVSIGDQEVHVRSLTIREIKRLDAVDYDARTGLVLGFALLEPDGSPVFVQRKSADGIDAETDSEFSDRVIEQLSETPMDNLAAVSQAVQRLGQPVDSDKLKKN